jgi:beta-lactam-binding protein with PASTA domain
LGEEKIPVPLLVGMSYKDAKELIEQQGLSLAATISYQNAVIKDTAAAFVVRQSPENMDEEKRPRYIQPGQVIDLWISPVMISLGDSTAIKN